MDPIDLYMQKRTRYDPSTPSAVKKFEKDKYKFCCRMMVSSTGSEDLKFCLDYFYKLQCSASDKRKYTELLDNVVYIYLRLRDDEKALETLNDWYCLEPENQEIRELSNYLADKLEYEAIDKRIASKVQEERLGVVRNEQSSYFTMKNLFFLGLALWGFNYLNSCKN